MAQKIRDRKIINRNESRISRQSSKPTIPRTAPARARGRSAIDFRNTMEDLGVDMEGTEEVMIYSPLYIYFFFLIKHLFFL